jgi:hypothetical protein
MGLKKNGKLTLIGTTLSVNIFLASEPDLDNIPNRESLDIVAMLTASPDAMNENPLRLFLRYDMP